MRLIIKTKAIPENTSPLLALRSLSRCNSFGDLFRRSAGYVDKILSEGRFETLIGADATAVIRHAAGVEIFFANGQRRHFDQIIFACHADQALKLIADPSQSERKILSAFRFTPNRAVLHTDRRFMPRRKHLWSSWNYLRYSNGEDAQLSLTYWMNRLQPLDTSLDLFVTLNPGRALTQTAVYARHAYKHPLFDAAALAAQRDLWSLQGRRRTWFCGSYFGYGFHEDGLQAGLAAAEDIGGVRRPWQVANESGRITVASRPAPIPEIALAAAQ